MQINLYIRFICICMLTIISITIFKHYNFLSFTFSFYILLFFFFFSLISSFYKISKLNFILFGSNVGRNSGNRKKKVKYLSLCIYPPSYVILLSLNCLKICTKTEAEWLIAKQCGWNETIAAYYKSARNKTMYKKHQLIKYSYTCIRHSIPSSPTLPLSQLMHRLKNFLVNPIGNNGVDGCSWLLCWKDIRIRLGRLG